MKFVLTFDCDNAAFEPDPADEILDILERVRRDIANGRTAGAIADTNGNRVGEFALVGGERPTRLGGGS
jgi:hypothetical protein